jgi:excisionase family DNA binding protein
MAEWLTVAEVAEYLRCGERTVRDAMANDQIPHVIFAGKALFNTERIDEWLRSMERGPLSEGIAKGPATREPVPLYKEKEMEVLPEHPRDKVAEILGQLMLYKDGKEVFVTGLCKNLSEDLNRSAHRSLSWKVYCQLSRWCHPRRWSEREKWVKPRAEEISKLLFGRIIDRA